MWKLHLKDLLGKQTLSSMRPVTVSQTVETLSDDRHKDLSKESLAHIKHFLSGVYTFARNQGHFDGANPVTGVKLPTAKGPVYTYAYSLQEEHAMIAAVKSRRAKMAMPVTS